VGKGAVNALGFAAHTTQRRATTHVRVAAIHHGGHGAASCKGWGRARL